jgi:hypothetical protein
MKDEANFSISNMAAFPIIHETKVSYILSVCNKNDSEVFPRFTPDEL